MTYWDPSVPEFYLAEGAQLTKAASLALQALEVEGTSAYMLVRDETSVSKSYNIIYGLCSEQPDIPHIVGGTHPGHAKIPATKSTFGDGTITLEQDHLSSVQVYTCEEVGQPHGLICHTASATTRCNVCWDGIWADRSHCTELTFGLFEVRLSYCVETFFTVLWFFMIFHFFERNI